MEEVVKLKRTWHLALVLQIIFNNFLYIYQLITFGWLMSCGPKDIKKCTLSHVLILIMTSQTLQIMGWLKTQELEWITREWKIAFLSNKKFLTCDEEVHFEKLSFCIFCMSKRVHLWNKEKCFSFHFESSVRSWDNQILIF